MSAENKTQPQDIDVAAWIDAVEPPRRAEEARRLDAIFREVTGFQPRLWGPTILGYGRYHYRYESGREGDFLATGFAPRKANQVLYIMPGYADFGPILDRLGPHRMGKSCLYITNLAKVDEAALRDLIAAGLERLNAIWPVEPR